MKIKIINNNLITEIYFDKPLLLSDIIKSNIPDFLFPCAGNGKCGKCIVKCDGKVSEPDDNEKIILEDNFAKGYRLACKTYALGDCVIYLENINQLKNNADISDSVVVKPMTGDKDCLVGVVDIGTTSVAVNIYKMPEFTVVKSISQRNLQSAYGADVLSRITKTVNCGSDELYKVINNQIDSMLGNVEFRIVTGNTAMLSFYKNIDVSSLSVAPFDVDELFGYINDNECIPKCISAFVGADVTCGIISSGMLEYEKALLIDIGTNGEIVYKNGDKFYCGSAAAGPAFECANIKNGVQSVDGAINKVYNIGNHIQYTVIGKKSPIGICGSGLIDAVATMLNLDIIDFTGYLQSDFYIGDSNVCITPNDIRNVQVAKASIRAAIEVICDDIDNVEKIYISGSFGTFLNIENAVKIGLIPKTAKNKVVLCGNTAATGAAMMLSNCKMFDLANQIAEKVTTVQLAGNDDFFKKYISFMNF